MTEKEAEKMHVWSQSVRRRAELQLVMTAVKERGETLEFTHVLKHKVLAGEMWAHS